MDRPRPQPGQKSRPIAAKGQNEIWTAEESKKYKPIKAAVKNSSSKGNVFNFMVNYNAFGVVINNKEFTNVNNKPRITAPKTRSI